ncbi:Hypothetical protein HVR_LOCUS1311 [uncultured virus]|nr:Hypothetical protein HVR_LOCUS1311 [uncultured virus]
MSPVGRDNYVYDERGRRFVVVHTLVTENKEPDSFKKRLKTILANEMITKLGI